MMDTGYFKIPSNMYIVLVSPPGLGRKTTTLRLGQGFLEALVAKNYEIHFSTQASTVAALVQQFISIPNKEHQSLTCFSSELGSFLGTSSAEMVDFLTDIYDAAPNWSKQTIGRKLEKIEAPWFNLLAATTTQWLGDNLSKTAVEGGFVSRCLFVYTDTRKRIAFPKLTEEQIHVRDLLISDLAHISRLRGTMVLSKEAHDYYEYWYNELAEKEQVVDHRVISYYERKHVHALKVAMALSLASNDSLVLEKRDIVAALDLLKDIEPGMKLAFSAVGKNQHGIILEKIKQQCRKHPEGLNRKQLVGMVVHDADMRIVDEQINTLLFLGDITLRNGRYFATT